MSNLLVEDAEDVLRDLEKYHRNNGEPGRYFGYEELNKYYTHKDAGVTDWTGFPGSGKTYFCLQGLFNLSIRYGKRHILWVPDIGGRKEVYAKLIKMYLGKDISNKYGNQISHEDMVKALPWLSYHFIVLKKKNFKKGVTPIEFWEFVCEYKDESGKGVDTCLADSWKNFKHEFAGREDTYLDEVLSIRNELAEENVKHIHTIAHAIKTELSGQKGDGKRRIPTAWDIKGGGSWYANGKNIITVDFPDKKSTWVNLYISKVKPEDVGHVGEVVNKMKLDVTKGQYYEVINGNNWFPFQYQDRPQTLEMDFGNQQPDLNNQPIVEVNNEQVPHDDLPF